MTKKGYLHWRCRDCGAYGHSNDRDAEAFIINRHRSRGHSVWSWLRGHKNKAKLLPPLVDAPVVDDSEIKMGTE